MTEQSVPLFDKAALMELCKGDVSKLPLFVVHDDEYWMGLATVDDRGRIHLGERQFKAAVAPFWPFKEPRRIGAVSVEMTLALEPHHIDGSADRTATVERDQQLFRGLAGQAANGRRADDE